MSDGRLFLSYTGFTKYDSCGMAYKLEYRDAMRPDIQDGRNTLVGNAMHQLLEDYINRDIKEEEWLINCVDEYFEKQVKKEKFVEWRNPDDREMLIARMKLWTANLAEIMEQYNIDPRTCRAETKIYLDTTINGTPVRLGGKIDLLRVKKDDSEIIFDLKASENKDIVKRDQITWYSLLLGMKHKDFSRHELGGYLLPGFKKPEDRIKVYKITREDKQALTRRIADVIKKIEEEKFEAKPEDSKCWWCPVKHVCPLFGGRFEHKSGIVSL
jgi:CRISPR/Cas system-associated exonuclease Cas4 (RecB family)